MSEVSGSTWPEQEAIEKWWIEVRLSLKHAATEYRLKLQVENTNLKKELEALTNKLTKLCPHEKWIKTEYASKVCEYCGLVDGR